MKRVDRNGYYGRDLALVHHLGFAFHAEACAPGILRILEPVRARGGMVLELGCGSGLLTKELLRAGHRVIATDASPSMLELAAELLAAELLDGDVELRHLTLPDDPVPKADAIVAVGHPINYLPDPDALDRALAAIADALRPPGLLAIDICDLEYGRARRGIPGVARVGETWAVIARYEMPSPDRFIRDITTFLREESGSWRRSDEFHENLLVKVDRVPELLARRGVRARIESSFGDETLDEGLYAVIGEKLAGQELSP